VATNVLSSGPSSNQAQSLRSQACALRSDPAAPQQAELHGLRQHDVVRDRQSRQQREVHVDVPDQPDGKAIGRRERARYGFVDDPCECVARRITLACQLSSVMPQSASSRNSGFSSGLSNSAELSPAHGCADALEFSPPSDWKMMRRSAGTGAASRVRRTRFPRAASSGPRQARARCGCLRARPED
jgi:hypothetical protein